MGPGLVLSAQLQPDSLAKVGVEIGRVRREYSYERRTLPGLQFLIVPVRFTAQPGGPSRLYFEFADPQTAELYLVHSRDKKLVPYGFQEREPMSEKRVFQTEVKRQVLDLKPGQPRIETYVFTIPARARAFELVLKDIKRPLRVRR